MQLDEDARATRMPGEDAGSDKSPTSFSLPAVSGLLVNKDGSFRVWVERGREAGETANPGWRLLPLDSGCVQARAQDVPPVCVLPGPAFRVAVPAHEEGR